MKFNPAKKASTLLLQISGYQSPLKAVYLSVSSELKKRNDTTEVDPEILDSDGYIDIAKSIIKGRVTEEQIIASQRNLKITCYILLTMMAYLVYSMFIFTDMMSFVSNSLVGYIVAAFYIKYRFTVWQLEMRKYRPFKEWVRILKSKPSSIFP